MPSKDIEMTHPKGEYAYLGQARELYGKNDLHKALEVLDDGINVLYHLLLQDTNVHKRRYASCLVSLRGIVYHDLDQPMRALKDFDSAKQLDPYNVDSYFYSGLIYLNYFRRPERAVVELYVITQIRFQHQNAHYYLAKAYYQSRHYDLAVESICDAASLGANDAISTFIQDLLRDKQRLAALTKEQVVFLIKHLPPSDSERLIDECFQRHTALGSKMWKPRFFKACDIHHGTLKALNEHKRNIINSRL